VIRGTEISEFDFKKKLDDPTRWDNGTSVSISNLSQPAPETEPSKPENVKPENVKPDSAKPATDKNSGSKTPTAGDAKPTTPNQGSPQSSGGHS
jgi:hypothetical protein